MEKIGTPECQLFIAAHYAQNNIDTMDDDWILEKKYKNFHGFTCRDFFNEKLGIKAVVVAETKKDRYQLSVIENASYKIFLEEMAKRPLFYYVPVVTNDGLIFHFEKTMAFDATGELDHHSYKQKPYLLKKLQGLFKMEEFSLLEKNTAAVFSKLELEDIIQTLERNNLEFNPKIFDLLDKETHQPFVSDVLLTIYEFPEDNKLTTEESIELIFSLSSQQKELSNEEYAKIKNLLKKVPLEEFQSVTGIMMGFRPKQDTKLENIVDLEISRKKNQLLWKKVLENNK